MASSDAKLTALDSPLSAESTLVKLGAVEAVPLLPFDRWRSILGSLLRLTAGTATAVAAPALRRERFLKLLEMLRWRTENERPKSKCLFLGLHAQQMDQIPCKC